MSNFAALIATIQANIKTNGNEEITGAVLQDVLEAMVDALGTEAINNLESALSDEETARQNADGTLQDNIDAETLRAGTAEAGLDNRLDTIEGEIPSAASSSNKLADKAYVDKADTALGNAIGAIEDAIENGYVYAGIATPSGTPASGKVFYLAVTAGTYTNYGALVVTQGINILKNNGTAWSQEQLIALDNTPTPSSSGLVKSGGIYNKIGENVTPIVQEIGVKLNLLNPNDNDIIVGYYLDYSDGVTLIGYAGWSTTGYIKIDFSTNYDLRVLQNNSLVNIYNAHVYVYDTNKQFISSHSHGSDFGNVQNMTLAEFLSRNPLPEGAKYIRISGDNRVSFDGWFFGIEEVVGSSLQFIPYNTDNRTVNERIVDLSEDVEIINKDKNLFNKQDTDCVRGAYLRYDDGVTLVSYPSWSTTGFIEIDVDKEYDIVCIIGDTKKNVHNAHWYCYDKNKVYLGNFAEWDFGEIQNRTLAEFIAYYGGIPAKAKYFRFSFVDVDWDSFIFGYKVLTDSAFVYIPYDSTLLKTIQDDINDIQDDINDIYDDINAIDQTGIDYDQICKSINRIADSTSYPIQTIEGFKYVAKTYGYKILLCDLMFTSDNVPVLSHDHYLNQYYNNVRLVGGGTIPDPSVEENRVYISQTLYQTLYDTYDFGIYKGSEFAGIKIPKFEDFVRTCRMIGCDIYVEVKSATPSQMLIALDIVRKYRMEDKTSWSAGLSSDGMALMQAITSAQPTARVSLMPSENITTSNVDSAALLKTGENEVFLFGWDSTNLTDGIVEYMIEKSIGFEIGTINTAQGIIDYFNRSNAQKYCTGIETQTVIAGKVLYNAWI